MAEIVETETKKETGKNPVTRENLIQVLSEYSNRIALAARLGIQYQGDRDLYEALGYKIKLDYADFYTQYTRQEIAKAVINRPVKATWQGPLNMIESHEAEDTEFEKAWKDLDRSLGLKNLFSRVDKLTGIGRYGVLLLGLNDVRNRNGFSTPVSLNRKYKLVYVKPFSENTAKIAKFEDNPSNERYGKPLYYSLNVVDPSSNRGESVMIHYSRIIHITDDNLESEIYGTPRLEAIFNRLMDLEKIVGGDGEMFWRGARPGYHGMVDKDFTLTEEAKKDLLDQLDEYEHNLRRFLINEGIDLKTLDVQISDPKPHVEVNLQLISADTGIPVRVLVGSERGELASTQDTTEWLSFVQARREDFAEPKIVRPTVDRFIELGILPEPTEDYTVSWQDLFSISEKARVDIGKARANSLRDFTYNPVAIDLVPPDAFLEFFLGFTQEQITLIRKMRDDQLGKDVMEAIKETLGVGQEDPQQPGQGTASRANIPQPGSNHEDEE